VKIALAHYHLKPGGVTQVMLNQARALLEAGDEVLVLSGEAPANQVEWEGIPVKIIPPLHYYRYRQPRENDAEKLAAEMAQAAEDAEVAIVHNPLIKKNGALIPALKLLAKEKPLLLQCHDLAEDFRPDVYAGEDYPADCHYAAINSRDAGFLRDAGLTDAGLHLIPNEVRCLPLADDGAEKRRFLYPVRGIRRKNLGEALLLSLFLPEGKTVALTQPPTTEKDAPYYRGWKELAAALALPAEFEVGNEGKSFACVLGSACAVITASVKEGFGFSFLEPWTAGLSVAGRRITYVCSDFEKNGVSFPALYERIALPECAATAGYAEAWRTKIEATFSRLCDAFRIPRPPLPAADALPDFGAMDEEMQADFLKKARRDAGLAAALADLNPAIKKLRDFVPDARTIQANRRAVAENYSREKIAAILRAACAASLKPVKQSIARKILLEKFLDPSHFFLVGVSGG
jgi:hypothetical protein